MVLFRMVTMAGVGLGFVAVLGWLTNWSYALYCYSVLMAGVAAQQARSATPLDVPLWMSSPGGRVFLSLVGLVALASPFLLGAAWFRWWWGFAGYVLGGLGVGLSMPLLPGVARLFLGLLLSLGAAAWLLT